uniref:Uncharacterized protein n=1 Tax=Anguilla anguilla TaxID=7936 RepID=A0A0E9S3Q6_ANGAN
MKTFSTYKNTKLITHANHCIQVIHSHLGLPLKD